MCVLQSLLSGGRGGQVNNLPSRRLTPFKNPFSENLDSAPGLCPLPQVISELVEQCAVSDIKEDKMFSTLRAMGDTIAVCDKLLRYPLPLAWSRHTSRCGVLGFFKGVHGEGAGV